ncbi:hypothetical protein BCV70DRAFT_201197 [Testicularia cyperi]|uniref:Inositol-pentakisphosphate 2-kinase n=1 Tax=Testicularia cyperi TaxID=1882483 RepID=A0A317XNW9_9BASI|nr:hypothetical protein BCV70DRAFT_201197 [Testicularia cyperi]
MPSISQRYSLQLRLWPVHAMSNNIDMFRVHLPNTDTTAQHSRTAGIGSLPRSILHPDTTFVDTSRRHRNLLAHSLTEMPPTPFQPSHGTPFKSTLSSSQQSRLNHSVAKPDSDSGPARLTAQDICPSDWRYLGEGGKNVVLTAEIDGTGPSKTLARFILPDSTLALRIAKIDPAHPSPDRVDSDDELDAFTECIIAPLLGNKELLPLSIPIALEDSRDRGIVDTLAARIEVCRPQARRASPIRIQADLLTHIDAVEDICAPLVVSSGPDHFDLQDTLCIEIKPKWGFLPCIDAIPAASPNRDIKSTYSRYKMHQVTKAIESNGSLSLEDFDALYDPLDLYSPDIARKRKAIEALRRDWHASQGSTNNLRLFWNGKPVAVNDAETLSDVARFLARQQGRENPSVTQNTVKLLDDLVSLLISELSTPRVPPAKASGQPCTVLDRLAFLQSSLDPLDVEGLAELWRQATGSDKLGVAASSSHDSSTASSPAMPDTVETLRACLDDLLPPTLPESPQANGTAESQLFRHISRFLVSSTFKDCSIMVRCNRDPKNPSEMVTKTKIIDLDMKPVSKLAKFQATDREVCSNFLRWMASLPQTPAPSVVP